MTITVENLEKNFGGTNVFKNVCFTIEKNDKIGIVGDNGEGKTTLMNILLGLQDYDKGNIKINPFSKIGYAEQNPTLIDGTLWEQLLSACSHIVDLKEKIAIIEKTISKEVDSQMLEKHLHQYANMQHEYESIGGYSYEQQARKIAFGLGFCQEDFAKHVQSFSGGQKTRMILAAALFGEPDFLFLDEPTNHLDIKMTQWLEEYLAAFNGSVVVISHDRYFLDKVATKILHLENGNAKLYKGNYSQFVEQKALRDKSQLAAYQKQQEHIEKTTEYIRRYKAGIKSKQARGRQSQLNRLERIALPNSKQNLSLTLPTPEKCSDKVLMLEKLTIGYQKPIIKDINLLFKNGDKTALIGDNGTGKTTLLKTIIEQITPLSGKSIIGSRVKVGYFSQGHDHLYGSQTILQHICQEYSLSEEYSRTILGGMQFRNDDVFKELDKLSGGERARIALLKLLLDGANFLILDEPTNHLDISTKQTVEDALAAWEGSVLIVSHDRYLLNKLANRIWAIEDNSITDYFGGYEYYLQKITQKDLQQPQKILTNKETKKIVTNKKTIDVQKKLDKIELSLREQEAFLKVLEKRISDPNEHLDLDNSKNLALEHECLQQKINDLMEDWERLLDLSDQG